MAYDIHFVGLISMPLPTTAANLAKQQADYATVISACKAVSACVGVTSSSFTDKYSWVRISLRFRLVLCDSLLCTMCSGHWDIPWLWRSTTS